MQPKHGAFRGHMLLAGAFTVAFLAYVTFVLDKAGVLPSFGNTYEVTATVPTADLLVRGARVTVAGADVGRVKEIDRAGATASGARLTLRITDDRVSPIPRDTVAEVRTRSQVGENFVALTIGRDKRTVPTGGGLSDQDAPNPVSVDEILSTLNGRTRTDARRLLTELGSTLNRRGPDLSRTLGGVNTTVPPASDLVHVLSDERANVAQLVDQVGQVLQAVADRQTAIVTVAREGARTLKTIGDRDAALQSTLRELPATLTTVREATTTVGEVSRRAVPVVDGLGRAAQRLQPAVAALGPAAADGRKVVADLQTATPQLNALLRAATGAARPLPGVLPQVRSVFCELNPALRYLLPYRKDVLKIGFHLGSASNSYDATGHMVRLVPVLNENSLSGAPPQVLAASNALLQSGTFLKSKTVNWDPYMKPGQIGKTAATSGSPSGPQGLKDSGFKYPRVEADC
ncbi:MAG: MCE family protein [Solirubrobacterales bacterium]|nr:MCE family protein [Solirubrobacterales bacterium]